MVSLIGMDTKRLTGGIVSAIIYIVLTIIGCVFLNAVRSVNNKKSTNRLPRRVLAFNLLFSILGVVHGLAMIFLSQTTWLSRSVQYMGVIGGTMMTLLIGYFLTFTYVLFCWIGIVAHHFTYPQRRVTLCRKISFGIIIVWIVLDLVINVAMIVIRPSATDIIIPFMMVGLGIIPFLCSILFVFFFKKLLSLILKLQNEHKRHEFIYKLTILSAVCVVALNFNAVYAIYAAVDKNFYADGWRIWTFIYVPIMIVNIAVLWFFNPYQKSASSPTPTPTPTGTGVAGGPAAGGSAGTGTVPPHPSTASSSDIYIGGGGTDGMATASTLSPSSSEYTIPPVALEEYHSRASVTTTSAMTSSQRTSLGASNIVVGETYDSETSSSRA
eukprot:TRINITY_DN7694_c0_g2_i1.p1 TRINITY_DN7694_c0_g2~~TRINITY_DN7694_c0_g2_i1.p1  ORF type:complete len:383 (-),score=40.56 TRINITY_DN7694_c0_g2_i1:72-1220(-)